MDMIMVETVVLVSRPLARVPLQLARECQGSFVLDLHQDLINRGVQRGEACESSSERLGASIFPFTSSCPSHLLPPVLLCFLMSLSLFRLLLVGQQCVFRVHVLSCPIEYIRHCFQVILIQGK